MWSQRKPVTLYIIQEHAIMAAEYLRIYGWQASNRLLQKFLRRTEVQIYIKLHGNRSCIIPLNNLERISKIRVIANGYELCNIYNQYV